MAAIRLKGGLPGEVNIMWEDPLGERVSTFAIKLDASWFVSFHKPKLERPIRPGEWTVSLQINPKANGPVLMKSKFLVVPITHESKQPLVEPQAVNAVRAASARPGLDPKKLASWKENVYKRGEELERWLDSLVARWWRMEGYCRTSVGGEESNGCTWLPECSSKNWSSFFPDPKSELGEIQTDGRIR